MIRILLVDDHQIVRSGVRRVLEETGRFDIVGEAAGVREALDRARLLRPDVVVLDLTLRDGSGLDVIADVRASGARVVILSMQDEPAYAVGPSSSEVHRSGHLRDSPEPRAISSMSAKKWMN